MRFIKLLISTIAILILFGLVTFLTGQIDVAIDGKDAVSRDVYGFPLQFYSSYNLICKECETSSWNILYLLIDLGLIIIIAIYFYKLFAKRVFRKTSPGK